MSHEKGNERPMQVAQGGPEELRSRVANEIKDGSNPMNEGFWKNVVDLFFEPAYRRDGTELVERVCKEQITALEILAHMSGEEERGRPHLENFVKALATKCVEVLAEDNMEEANNIHGTVSERTILPVSRKVLALRLFKSMTPVMREIADPFLVSTFVREVIDADPGKLTKTAAFLSRIERTEAIRLLDLGRDLLFQAPRDATLGNRMPELPVSVQATLKWSSFRDLWLNAHSVEKH